MKITKILLSGLIFVFILSFSLQGSVFYVSKAKGSNGNAGTKNSPLKNIEKALKIAKPGDSVYIAKGNYYGMRNKGYIESPIPVKLFGGYSDDFSTRDILKNLTLISPDNKSASKSRKALLTFKKSSKGNSILVDGIVFDMGMRNSYSKKKGKPEGCATGMLLLPPQKESGENPTVTEQCIYFPSTASAGDVLIRNCVFLNSAKFAIQGGHKGGNFKIINNVFVANRMAAIEIFGTGGRKGPGGPVKKDGNVEIANNTILFSWSRTKDFKDMGYGIRVMTKLSYNIHDNIIGCNIMTGIDDTRFNKNEWIKLDNNIFFLNRQGDLMYSEPGQGTLERVTVNEFEDLDFLSVKNNKNFIPKTLKIDKNYLKGFLSARYSEKKDFNPNSSANIAREIFGLPKRGKLSSTVSMYMNRYQLNDALKLFGGVKGKGAQKPVN